MRAIIAGVILRWHTVLVMLALICVGCERASYGVVLWPDDSFPYLAGKVVQLYPSSNSIDRYNVSTDERDDRYSLDGWRVVAFDNRISANEYADFIKPYASLYARPTINALPVRKEAARFAPIIYRLRINEIIKVITREQSPANEAGLADYWYQVLMIDGSTGWVFGERLDLFDQLNLSIASDEGSKSNTVISNFLTSVWRPSYYREMIDTDTIDTNRFQAKFGLFPEPHGNLISIILPEKELKLYYDSIKQNAPDSLLLLGTSAQITMNSSRHITVLYSSDRESWSHDFLILEEDIIQIAQRQRAKAEVQYNQLLQHGSRWHNGLYGTIHVDDRKRFSWVPIGILDDSLFESDMSGQIEINPSIAQGLRKYFDGELIFQPDSPDSQNVIRLLYRVDNNAITLTPLSFDASEIELSVDLTHRPLWRFSFR